ncbi:hypothetical protein [Xanthomonas bonasiae]|uniref:hypothetical protein n=1 Tax=Xanthomonas bonasiae TaxID=2810351 RepID=UPI0030B8A6A2
MAVPQRRKALSNPTEALVLCRQIQSGTIEKPQQSPQAPDAFARGMHSFVDVGPRDQRCNDVRAFLVRQLQRFGANASDWHLYLSGDLSETVVPTPFLLRLPMPADTRLRKIVQGTRNDETWARRAGMSEHTLAYLLMHQTGMSFGVGASNLT